MKSNQGYRLSVVFGLVSLGLLSSMLLTSMNTPGSLLLLIYGGILVSGVLSVICWRKEHRAGRISSTALWLVGWTLFLFLLLFVILPGIPW